MSGPDPETGESPVGTSRSLPDREPRELKKNFLGRGRFSVFTAPQRL